MNIDLDYASLPYVSRVSLRVRDKFGLRAGQAVEKSDRAKNLERYRQLAEQRKPLGRAA